MNNLLIAKVLGVYVIVSGLFLILRGKTLPMLLKDFFEHKAVMFLSGAVLIFVGGVVAFLPAEPRWITIVGWLILLKGVLYILAPELFMRLLPRKTNLPFALLGIISSIIGLFLTGIL
ncbi:MAG: hypothetical protein A3A33_01225 [Candidatus Yanofskybacteria bacterium RIFCSPLOWO2_01_FULL_49_25]|uniref:DUF2065 domain-containing protein n=1 Tax=Candidatus Yanofskybacteria bacterium RIFCSPLOWO2_01_FULL_49_25 TaxID=1802701 RepID=A0A1F8GX02_9BACT|nr:MAG: hypothetical protein A3A33_01225 [Candidatus Yanofskybacteria bacterium RIFCSPLOWO2_01_FULL_49_25]